MKDLIRCSGLKAIRALFFMLLICAASLATSLSALAAEKAIIGEILFAVGERWKQDAKGAQRVEPKRGTALYVGDVLSTNDSGFLQIKMIDGAFISLRSNSRLRINSYHYDPEVPANNKVNLSLEEGVVRSVTGKAGENNRKRFRLNTPIAAIGVRGTDFTVFTDANQSQVAVARGGIVISPFSESCSVAGEGPCEGKKALELFAQHAAYIELRKGVHIPVIREGMLDYLQPTPDEVESLIKNQPSALRQTVTGERILAGNTNGMADNAEVSESASTSDVVVGAGQDGDQITVAEPLDQSRSASTDNDSSNDSAFNKIDTTDSTLVERDADVQVSSIESDQDAGRLVDDGSAETQVATDLEVALTEEITDKVLGTDYIEQKPITPLVPTDNSDIAGSEDVTSDNDLIIGDNTELDLAGGNEIIADGPTIGDDVSLGDTDTPSQDNGGIDHHQGNEGQEIVDSELPDGLTTDLDESTGHDYVDNDSSSDEIADIVEVVDKNIIESSEASVVENEEGNAISQNTAVYKQHGTSSGVKWGRWSDYSRLSGKVDAFMTGNEGYSLHSQNSRFVLFRKDEQDIEYPNADVFGFNLSSYESVYVVGNKVETAALNDGKLSLDFGRSTFSTSFNISSESLDSYQFQDQGIIDASGSLRSKDVSGFVNRTVDEAGFLFDRKLTPDSSVSGVTYWDR